MKKRQRIAILFAGVVLLMALVTACRQSEEAEEHTHDHHDEHSSVLASFESSVEDVLEHDATIQEAFESDNPDAAHDALHVIGHLIEQLPELAVDTDLSEVDWSEVQGASDQLKEAYGHLDAQFHGVKDGPSFADVKPTIQQATEVLRKLVGAERTRQLFGGETWRGQLKAWAWGMLLPVCSLGVFPIMAELRRSKVSTGSIITFALTAPLFNPLSLLYGFSLATPGMVFAFAFASLIIVTFLGYFGNQLFQLSADASDQSSPVRPVAPGWQRMVALVLTTAESLTGVTLLYCLVGLMSNLTLCLIFPQGSFQSQFAHDDPLAPLIMLPLATLAYATPMNVMSQIGSMLVHGNSVGAAFSLLALGTGLHLGTWLWLGKQSSWGRSFAFLVVATGLVTMMAYAMNQVLYIRSSVEHPHTHAFDRYSAPFAANDPDVERHFQRSLQEGTQSPELFSLGIILTLVLAGSCAALFQRKRRWEDVLAEWSQRNGNRYDLALSNRVLAVAIGTGLLAVSILGCFIHYPPPSVTLDEMKFVRGEAFSAIATGDVETAVRDLQRYEELSRRLDVGYFLRKGRLAKLQHSSTARLRSLLEACKDDIEAGRFDQQRAYSHRVFLVHQRCRSVFCLKKNSTNRRGP